VLGKPVYSSKRRLTVDTIPSGVKTAMGRAYPKKLLSIQPDPDGDGAIATWARSHSPGAVSSESRSPLTER
jgi:hypothetical protein